MRSEMTGVVRGLPSKQAADFLSPRSRQIHMCLGLTGPGWTADDAAVDVVRTSLFDDALDLRVRSGEIALPSTYTPAKPRPATSRATSSAGSGGQTASTISLACTNSATVPASCRFARCARPGAGAASCRGPEHRVLIAAGGGAHSGAHGAGMKSPIRRITRSPD